jgi:hypothetical protein
MNDRSARPHRRAVIHHPLCHQHNPWHLQAGAGRAAPQQAPTQQMEVEVGQLGRVGAVQGHPDEAQVTLAGRLGHSDNGSRADLARARPKPIGVREVWAFNQRARRAVATAGSFRRACGATRSCAPAPGTTRSSRRVWKATTPPSPQPGNTDTTAAGSATAKPAATTRSPTVPCHPAEHPVEFSPGRSAPPCHKSSRGAEGCCAAGLLVAEDRVGGRCAGVVGAVVVGSEVPDVEEDRVAARASLVQGVQPHGLGAGEVGEGDLVPDSGG